MLSREKNSFSYIGFFIYLFLKLLNVLAKGVFATLQLRHQSFMLLQLSAQLSSIMKKLWKDFYS